MKYIFLILIINFIYPQEKWKFKNFKTFYNFTNRPATISAEAEDECSNFFICQNYEEFGFDNNETWDIVGDPTPDPDYTDIVLRGSQSLFIDAIEGYTTMLDISPHDSIYFHFLFQFGKLPDSYANFNFAWGDGPGDILFIGIYSDGTLEIDNGSSYDESDIQLTPETLYHIWGFYKKGTGSNSIARIWISTNNIRPESVEMEILDGDSVDPITNIEIGLDYDDIDAVYDQVLYSENEFLFVPE